MGWLAFNGDGIYDAVASVCSFANKRNIRYTHKEGTEYMFWLQREEVYLPPYVYVAAPMKIESVRLLRTGQNIPSVRKGDNLILDTSTVPMRGAEYGDCFEMIHA